jgi:hypothetical protein
VQTETENLQTALPHRYRIERELGEGGFATVYLAHDLKYDRKVALKVLKPEIAQTLGGERFQREIQLGARRGRDSRSPVRHRFARMASDRRVASDAGALCHVAGDQIARSHA